MAPARRFEGIPDETHKLLVANMDEAPARRRAREAFKDIQLGIDHCLLKLPYDEVKMEELYEKNSRGVEIFSKSWLPKNSPLKGVICFCHGYGDTCTFFFEGIARKLASCGYGVFAMDYPGFGLSEGLHGYIPNFDVIVDDAIEHFSKIKENVEFQSLPSFLFGQSMGGAVVLKVHFKQPKAWDGAILVAPMCKIADDMVPPWAVTKMLIGLAKVLPKAKLVPQDNLADMAFRDMEKKKLAKYNVIVYKDKPRLGTALQLLKITAEIEHRLAEVSLPLLILHGEADVVTDPSVSKALYEKASSSDKKLLLYKDAYHCLLEGEPDEMIFRVFGDIISWLDEHSIQKAEGMVVNVLVSLLQKRIYLGLGDTLVAAKDKDADFVDMLKQGEYNDPFINATDELLPTKSMHLLHKRLFQGMASSIAFNYGCLLTLLKASCYRGRYRGRVFCVAKSWDPGGSYCAMEVLEDWTCAATDSNFEGKIFQSGGE